jgi:hypothetical protein
MDDFKHQVERKQREVSELVLDIRIKDWRQSNAKP